ncbi:hypothetical protein [Ideonella livida]|uniref:DUF3108 domain-containing protein n=1 Tax=Ideonella livida TaxID=2707176 RepID=A0A7C9PGZ8_9BURK|nr:hypothetical protein [Ideonella livida]NDY90794.1 hypothetical protein [Ideonella livida]
MAGATLVVGLSACSPPPGDELFPLGQGRHWTYRQVTTWENDTVETDTVEISGHGSELLEDGQRAFRRRSASGMTYWLRSDETGVYRVASKSDVEAEPQPDKPVRFVLKAPIAAGTSWQATTTAYLLRRRQEFPREIRHSHPRIPMNYIIEALGETVDTPAGRFSACVRVKGSAQLKLFADPVVGWKDMPLTTLEWYCPGVGLAKLQRTEPANSTFLEGGTVTLELTDYR